MALWGNSDNVGSGGLVSLNYSTKVVVGTGTTFGAVGAAKTGDVIRFGIRGGNYFGDAVIVGIASTTQLTIGSTAGLSGVAIASTDFYVSQLPKFTILDYRFSNALDVDSSFASLTITGTATQNSGIGTNIVSVVPPTGLIIGDALVNNGNNIVITTLGNSTISLASTISVGISTGNTLSFKRRTNGYDSQVYGIGRTNLSQASTKYRTNGDGWVGVTTYIDTHGNLRVKSEILVSMSGITTSNDSIVYPTNK